MEPIKIATDLKSNDTVIEVYSLEDFKKFVKFAGGECEVYMWVPGLYEWMTVSSFMMSNSIEDLFTNAPTQKEFLKLKSVVKFMSDFRGDLGSMGPEITNLDKWLKEKSYPLSLIEQIKEIYFSMINDDFDGEYIFKWFFGLCYEDKNILEEYIIERYQKI